jgi:hypothetical protein
VSELVGGDLAEACLRLLCAPQLTTQLADRREPVVANGPAGASSRASVVAVEPVSDDGHIATVNVWVEEAGAGGRLRPYLVTLARQFDGTWLVAWVTP